MKIVTVHPDSIAEELGILPGDELLEMNGRRVMDAIDLRFHEPDATLTLKVARGGEVIVYDIEKDDGDPLGLELEEMRVLACGNDCIFCFVDQNPKGLRQQLYFRDGDYRMSFMYGNYTTMTNAGPAVLRRIIAQRLSPQYISVHTTDPGIRKALMGLKKDDHILEKIRLLHDHGIDMHTQIVLCPGINDGTALATTVEDLFRFHRRIVSLAVVPVGLTDNRSGLAQLTHVDAGYAGSLLETVEKWQRRFRKEIGRAFVYPSDEFYIVAGRSIPPGTSYDGFPQIENGVGIVRKFIMDFRRQARTFPKRLPRTTRLMLVTAELPSGFMQKTVLPRLQAITNLDVALEIVPNRLFGRSVTVAGLLSGKCVYSALSGKDCGDLVLLPPDIVNADGLLLDDTTVPDLSQRLSVPVTVYDGRWSDVFPAIHTTKGKRSTKTLVHGRTSHSQLAYTYPKV